VSDTRVCELCGDPFAPHREHARFCSASCRVAWNAEHTGNPVAAVNALNWSVTAMNEVTDRLAHGGVGDLPRAVTAISEAVWWVTIVDATMVRYHPTAYDNVLATQPPARRLRTEETLTGLRFVRNHMGVHLDPAEFIRAAETSGDAHAVSWRWNPVPEPVTTSLSPRGRQWEMTRYRAYQARLADRDSAKTFTFTAGFLRQIAMSAPADISG
jgi:hypothetical protein